MAPVLGGLRDRGVPTLLVSTAQHREMLDGMLAAFSLVPDEDLAIMTPRQTLEGITAAIMTRFPPLLEKHRPPLVLVQGDTTTVLAVALASFYHGVPVGHVEAGLRSGNPRDPFPEEMNRRLTDDLSDLLFAPTDQARKNLIAEGISGGRISVTGNTVVDALRSVAAAAEPPPEVAPAFADGGPVILVTTHRRENWGEPLERIGRALLAIVKAVPEARIVLPMHLNPAVRERLLPILSGHPAITLTEPLDYRGFVGVMSRATLVLSDSGGVQEEAPSLGVPVLVLRETTERPEGVAAGVCRLVGTDEREITDRAVRLLRDADLRASTARAVDLYGDGHAGERIAAAVVAFLAGRG